jgi:hypothetical protein
VTLKIIKVALKSKLHLPSGRPDDFMAKITQSVAQTIVWSKLTQNHFCEEK